MSSTAIALALALAAVSTFAMLVAGGGAIRLRDRSRFGTGTAVLAVLALAALVSHLGLIDRDRDTRDLRRGHPPIHVPEIFHYFLGAKYFRELGHDGLYEAVVIADREDQPNAFRPDNRFRDLRTNRVDRIRRDVIAEGAVAKTHFSAERWRRFKDDVALIREASPSIQDWHRSALLRDHGYNGTPLTTAILGTLANQTWIPSPDFLLILRYTDTFLIALCVAGLAGLIGAAPALAFALFWYANPLNDYGFIGGSFLRYNFALALIFAWLALERGSRTLAGGWLAAASHFRIFPVFFALGLLLYDAVQADRVERLRANASLYAGFAATGLALVLATAWIQDPQGRSVWIAFSERLGVHSQAYSTNSVGLKALFSYSPEHTPENVEAAHEAGTAIDWEDFVGQTVARRAPGLWAATAVLFAATALCARVLPERHALFLGFPLIFTFLYLSHYYYCALGLLALVFRDDPPVLVALAGFTGLLLLAAVPTAFEQSELRYAVVSGLLLAMFVSIGALAARREPAETPSP